MYISGKLSDDEGILRYAAALRHVRQFRENLRAIRFRRTNRGIETLITDVGKLRRQTMRLLFPNDAERSSRTGTPRGRFDRGMGLGLLAFALAAGIFVIDALTSLESAVAVLYVVVILLVARACERTGIIATAAGCLTLTAAGYLISHGISPVGSPLLRCLVSLIAIGIAAALVLQNQRAAAALAEKANLVELTHDAIIVRDRDGIITFWNRAAEAMYGWRRDEVLGKVSHELLATVFPTDRDTIDAELRRQGWWEGELVQTKSSGETIVVESRWAPQPDTGNGPPPVMETNTDVSGRKQAQERLLMLQTELTHVARVSTLGELTASIAHEINQPLTAIASSGDAALRWLKRDEPDLGEVTAALALISANAMRAGEIVSRIRTFLKKTPARRERLDLAETIGEAIRLVERELAHSRVTLRREFEPSLPRVYGNRVELQQVMINLMVNAIQAMTMIRNRPRLLTLRVERESDDHIRIEVIDSGNGVAQEAVEEVFRPFFTTKRRGMGMGLAICRSTIEAHGGQMWVSGHTEPGAAFHIRIPAIPGGGE